MLVQYPGYLVEKSEGINYEWTRTSYNMAFWQQILNWQDREMASKIDAYKILAEEVRVGADFEDNLKADLFKLSENDQLVLNKNSY